MAYAKKSTRKEPTKRSPSAQKRKTTSGVGSKKKGNRREYYVREQVRSLGFIASRISASGQRISESSKRDGIPGDIIALARRGSDYGFDLLIEVGGPGKSIKGSFAELSGACTGTRFALVAINKNRRWYWHTTSRKHACETLAEALTHIRNV